MTQEIGISRSGGSARLAGVDVLRGLCVLLVVLHHINLRFVLGGSILLGYVVARNYSEPLNRRIRVASGVAFSSALHAQIASR